MSDDSVLRRFDACQQDEARELAFCQQLPLHELVALLRAAHRHHNSRASARVARMLADGLTAMPFVLQDFIDDNRRT